MTPLARFRRWLAQPMTDRLAVRVILPVLVLPLVALVWRVDQLARATDAERLVHSVQEQAEIDRLRGPAPGVGTAVPVVDAGGAP